MSENALTEHALGDSASRLDPRTKLLALLLLNAIAMRSGPTTTLIAAQIVAAAALAWEVSGRSALRSAASSLAFDAISLGSPALLAWAQWASLPRGVGLAIGTVSAIAYWFARFSAGLGLALYVYRTTRVGQMKAALRTVHLPRPFVDALVVAFRVIPAVGTGCGSDGGDDAYRMARTFSDRRGGDSACSASLGLPVLLRAYSVPVPISAI